MLWRWVWFWTIGRAVDHATIGLAMCLLPFSRILYPRNRFESERVVDNPEPRFTVSQLVQLAKEEPVRDIFFADCTDNHNLMCQVGHGYFNWTSAQAMASKAITPDGSLYRFVPGGYGADPSRDILSAWVYFYVVNGVKAPWLVAMLAESHWNNVFNLRNREGKIGAKGCNAGFMPMESDEARFSAPNFGQGYCATASLLYLAAKTLGGKWRLRYWLYYFACGGWFWERFPNIPLKKLLWKDFYFYYAIHTSQMSLCAMALLGKDVRSGMRWNAIFSRPAQGPQPFVTGMLAQAGYATEEEKAQALRFLLASDVTWPQYFQVGWEPNRTHSMMAHCALQLCAAAANP